MTFDNHELRLLVLGIRPDDVEGCRRALERAGVRFDARLVDDAEGLSVGLEAFEPDLVLSECSVGPLTGPGILELVRANRPSTPLIIVTRSEDEDLAARCLDSGVAAWVPARRLEELGPAVVRALLASLRNLSPIAGASGDAGSRQDRDDFTPRSDEEALLRSEADLNRAQSIAKIGSWTIDLDAKTVTGSDEASRIYGLKRRDLTLERIQQVPLPEYRAMLDDALESAVHGGGHYDIEFKIRRPSDGAILDIHSMAEYDAGRNILVGTIQDVTAANAAEKDRLESEQRYLRLFERNLAGVYRTAADGEMLDCNDAFASILGYSSREELLGLNAQRFYFDMSQREKVLATLRDCAELRNFELQLKRNDGSPCWCLLNSILVRGENGGPMTIEGTVIDITDRKLMTERLDEAQKMETVAVLAGGVAHEFNNLLQSISGLARDLRRRPTDGRQLHGGFDELDLLVERGSQLTRQLLVFSQTDSVDYRLIDLNEGVNAACELFRVELQENIDLVLELSEEVLPVQADQGQMEQVVINLGANAQEAMPDGGRVVVRSGSHDAEYVFLEVEDNGRGIAEDVLGRVFEPFFTTKAADPGSGIGLAVVHGIVNRCGGRVEVRSEVGVGTTFRVLLPARPPASTPDDRSNDRSREPALIDREDTLILVVDDEPLVREGVQEMLTEMGYPVISADSIATAKQSLSNLPIRLLLTDIVLPDGSGMELVEIAGSLDPILPAIAMTGYSPESLGGDEISVPLLLKPFGLAKLEKAMDAALAASRD